MQVVTLLKSNGCYHLDVVVPYRTLLLLFLTLGVMKKSHGQILRETDEKSHVSPEQCSSTQIFDFIGCCA